MTELQPRYDARASFYGKAYYDETADTKTSVKTLYSYDTKVASVTRYKDGQTPTVWVGGYYSQTTARHVNEFLQQNGFDTMNKKQQTQGGY